MLYFYCNQWVTILGCYCSYQLIMLGWKILEEKSTWGTCDMDGRILNLFVGKLGWTGLNWMELGDKIFGYYNNKETPDYLRKTYIEVVSNLIIVGVVRKEIVTYFMFQHLSLLTALVSKIWMRWTLRLSVIHCTRHIWKLFSISARSLEVPQLMSCVRFLL